MTLTNTDNQYNMLKELNDMENQESKIDELVVIACIKKAIDFYKYEFDGLINNTGIDGDDSVIGTIDGSEFKIKVIQIVKGDKE